MTGLKHFIAAIATPLAFALMLALIGALFRWRGRRRAAIVFVSLAIGVAYLGALPLVGMALIAPLERGYGGVSAQSLYSPEAIVVLGSGYSPAPGISITGAIDEDGLARVIEGIRLAKRFPDARLVLSGGGQSGETPSALGYAVLARELGVPESRIVMLDFPLDTDDESRAVANLLGRAPFVLVTSAYHMPRSMQLMRRAGAHPIPAPAGERLGKPPATWWRALVPSGWGLRNTERALHEYLGLTAMCLGMD